MMDSKIMQTFEDGLLLFLSLFFSGLTERKVLLSPFVQVAEHFYLLCAYYHIDGSLSHRPQKLEKVQEFEITNLGLERSWNPAIRRRRKKDQGDR